MLNGLRNVRERTVEVLEVSFGGLRGGSALYLLFSLQCRVARSNERPSAARSGAKCLLELTLTYLERLVATRCAWAPLCCASVRAHFHTLTTGSALNSAQAAKANAATSANPDGRISRAGNLIGAGVAADDRRSMRLRLLAGRPGEQQVLARER